MLHNEQNEVVRLGDRPRLGFRISFYCLPKNALLQSPLHYDYAAKTVVTLILATIMGQFTADTALSVREVRLHFGGKI